ncbi:MAG: hypothetical protein JW709_04705 [Sedimentisphaerales bacterium]|nr:hypothetical protein [Sedimentisphaerales bacterium]
MSPVWKLRLVKVIIALVIVVVALAVLAIGAFLAVTRRPSAYHPAPLTAEQETLIDHVINIKGSEIISGAGYREPYEVFFEQDLINGILLHSETRSFMEQTLGKNAFMRDPQVAFTPDGIDIMAAITYDDLDTVMTLRLRPGVNAAGNLEFELTSIRAGAMPIPESYLREKLLTLTEKLDNKKTSFQPNGHAQEKRQVVEQFTRFIPAVQDLIKTGRAEVKGTFQPTTDDIDVKVTNIQVTHGKLTLLLTPLPEKKATP